MYRLTQAMLTRSSKEDEDFDIYFGNRRHSATRSTRSWWRRFTDHLWALFLCSFGRAEITGHERKRETMDDLKKLADTIRLEDIEDVKKNNRLVARSNLPVIWVMGGPGAPIQALIYRISKVFNFHYVFVGDILKDEISTDMDHPELARKLMDRGVMIPRRFLLELIEADMAKAIKLKSVQGFLFSDFPSTYSQAVTFIHKICSVDFIMVLKFDDYTMRMNAYSQLRAQAYASKTIHKSKAELKVAAEESVRAYQEDLRKLYKLVGNKMQVIDSESTLSDVCHEFIKWMERAMIIHDIHPPPSIENPIRQFTYN